MALASLQKSREKAFRVLLENERNAKRMTVSAENEDGGVMQAYLTELVNNIVKQKKLLDYHIEHVSGRKKALLKKEILVALRFGFYFLLFDPEMPEYAAVNESAVLLKGKKERGFLNAVLRKYIRNKAGYELPRSDSVKDIAVRCSHPEWFVKFAVDKFGAGKAVSVFRANNSVPPLWLRLNWLKFSGEQMEQFLKDEGIVFERDKDIDFLYRAGRIRGLLYNKFFEEGAFYIQDKAAVLPCLYLNRFEGDEVLDVCSAPGGKATLTLTQRPGVRWRRLWLTQLGQQRGPIGSQSRGLSSGACPDDGHLGSRGPATRSLDLGTGLVAREIQQTNALAETRAVAHAQ
ncbi:MAG: hypothetical protein JW728_01965 [Candidatus Aureabacteria bacterium]|nr:hypothetical protein [Candidatus Auribacterota bacterium]